MKTVNSKTAKDAFQLPLKSEDQKEKRDQVRVIGYTPPPSAKPPKIRTKHQIRRASQSKQRSSQADRLPNLLHRKMAQQQQPTVSGLLFVRRHLTTCFVPNKR